MLSVAVEDRAALFWPGVLSQEEEFFPLACNVGFPSRLGPRREMILGWEFLRGEAVGWRKQALIGRPYWEGRE